jgi:hypothetical protein
VRYRDLLEKSGDVRVYAHVSPGQNLESILRQGLLPNENGGNYSGYWEALSGVYVTNNPHVLRQHIFARSMEDHYVIVLVQVAGRSYPDEDVIDNLLHKCAQDVLQKHGMTVNDIEDIAMDNELGQDLIAAFKAALGTPKRGVLAKEPTLIEEFVEAWLNETIYGGDGPEGDWWTYAKGLLLRAFRPADTDANLRSPQRVGYTGRTHMIGVVDVRDGVKHVVKGTVSPEAQPLTTV